MYKVVDRMWSICGLFSDKKFIIDKAMDTKKKHDLITENLVEVFENLLNYGEKLYTKNVW